MERFLSLLIGYLFGGLMTAEFVSRACTGKSAREIGSHNPGMTNIMSHVGKLQGSIVLMGDILKTAAAMGISFLCFSSGAGTICVQYAGLGAVLGHNFPLWLRGRGGKGVTVTCTWMILGFGIWGVFSDLAGGITVFLTGWLPLAAVVLAIAAIPMAFLTAGTEAGILVCISCGLMFSRHWHGLRRILRGEEGTHLKLLKKRG